MAACKKPKIAKKLWCHKRKRKKQQSLTFYFSLQTTVQNLHMNQRNYKSKRHIHTLMRESELVKAPHFVMLLYSLRKSQTYVNYEMLNENFELTQTSNKIQLTLLNIKKSVGMEVPDGTW